MALEHEDREKPSSRLTEESSDERFSVLSQILKKSENIGVFTEDAANDDDADDKSGEDAKGTE